MALLVSFEENTEKRLNDHGDRIRALEIKDATQNEQLATLFKKLDDLSSDIRDLMALMKSVAWKLVGGVTSLLAVFLGFFIWYVQKLGGG